MLLPSEKPDLDWSRVVDNTMIKLYNLVEDPTETNNLVIDMPSEGDDYDVMIEMLDKIADWHANSSEPRYPDAYTVAEVDVRENGCPEKTGNRGAVATRTELVSSVFVIMIGLVVAAVVLILPTTILTR